MLEIIIPSVISIVLTGIITLTINFFLQRKAKTYDFQLVTYESLDKENKELRKESFKLQQQILELSQVNARLKAENTILSNEKNELYAKADELSKQLLAAREKEFQLYTELEVMKKQIRDLQEYIRSIEE